MTDRPEAGARETDRIDIIVGVEPGTLDSVREILAEYAALPHNVGRQHGTEDELAGLPDVPGLTRLLEGLRAR